MLINSTLMESTRIIQIRLKKKLSGYLSFQHLFSGFLDDVVYEAGGDFHYVRILATTAICAAFNHLGWFCK